jgi:rubrerythrin
VILHTTSEGISLARQLENDSAGFYEELAERYAKYAEAFLSIASENKKNIVQTERVYFGVITDALEGGYAFNLDTDNYTLNVDIQDKAGIADILSKALEIEDIIIKFYSDAAEQSKSLMADIPRAFMLLAKKRNGRKVKLEALLHQE